MSEPVESPSPLGEIIGSTAIFASSDIPATIDFYRRVLGFESSWTWGEPPTFGSVSRGSSTIMFNLQPELAAKVRGHQHWLRVLDVNSLYAEHVARGAKVVSEIADRPWGVREYVVEDLDGYHLRFAGDIESHTAPSAAFPEGVRIVRRVPTTEEYMKLAGPEFHEDHMPEGVLERTWSGVVAQSAEGEAIGMLRVMCDSPGWFSIWHVVVAPEWRGRRIGERMMKEALAMVHEASPGAWVFLFTFKHGFYQKLGFEKQTLEMRKV